ncbi:membrane protein [Streptomyces echinoruber]|uniref:Membrane protein n=2 Tax=Streptomyces echinoruber TaxID=68898 RepID=A0A918RC36_9ACTN|nr:membrane protein [Streptomyces echinoruber]
MSMTPPPGWYPDPAAPHQERWWDGTAWTEHRRAPAPPAAPVPPVPPLPSSPSSPLPGGSARAKAVALTVAAAVLVAAIVTGAVVLRDGDGGGARAKTAPTSPVASPHPTSASPSAPAPTDDPSVVVDQLNGITLPLPDGWVRPRYVSDDAVVMTTDGTYDCPGGTGFCRHGLVSTRTASAGDGTPEAIARDDIEDAADLAYDRDRLDERPYGGITAHREVKSGTVAVAGRAGYFVRWRVTTAKGPGGYVESLVFPSSTGTESPVVVRFVFDAGPDGPPLSDMDRITQGIRPLGDAATGGGVGSSIGPTG